MYDILDTMDALLKQRHFYPNFNAYRTQLDSAGIAVPRMEVAMSAVLAKAASRQTNTTWENFQTVQDFKLKTLPPEQVKDIQVYWATGPNPGLQAGTVPVSPAVGNQSWDKYVDQFTECVYDVNYNVTNYFSTTLRLKFADSTSLDLDIETDFSDMNFSSTAARDSMAAGKIGRSGRIFPTSLNSRTVPRLYAARAEAFRIQNEEFKSFANLAVTGVAFVLSVPAMPAGAMAEEVAAGARVTRREISGTARAASIAENELKAINAIRAANPELASLTIEEMMAIRAYTREDWATINFSLRGGSASGGASNAMASDVISGLKKLPGYSGKLVRSESFAVNEAAARYVPGKQFVPEGLFSTSSAGAVAQREGNVAITVNAIGKAGKDISKISAQTGKESEILFAPGTRFLVDKATRVGDALLVVLREL